MKIANTDPRDSLSNDFGFSMVEVDVEKAEKTAETSERKTELMYDMIMPLLENLKANPDTDYIHWPGKKRVDRINEFIRELKELMNLSGN